MNRRAAAFISALAACGLMLVGVVEPPVASAGVELTPMTAMLQAKLAALPPSTASTSTSDEPPAAETEMQSIHQAISSITSDSNTYGGLVDHPSTGTVTLYVTADGLSSATAAIASAGESSAVNVVTVGRSYQNLEALANLITSDQAQISAAGIGMQSWATSIASNTVNVVVSSPVAAASSFFNDLYGAGTVSVTSADGSSVADTATRFADTTPYFDGDEIVTGGSACTSNFYFIGNNSGKPFGLTAGHCPSGTVTQNGATIGKTSTNYFKAGGEDAQSYTCQNEFSTCAGGFVYYGPDSGQYYTVTQLCGGNCQVGDLVTADGDQNNGYQVPDNKITTTDYNYDDKGITETHLDEANNQNGTQPAVGGDSGGPVYQRHSGGTAWANGMIIAEITPPVYGVIYDPMSQVLSTVNGSLITG